MGTSHQKCLRAKSLCESFSELRPERRRCWRLGTPSACASVKVYQQSYSKYTNHDVPKEAGHFHKQIRCKFLQICVNILCTFLDFTLQTRWGPLPKPLSGQQSSHWNQCSQCLQSFRVWLTRLKKEMPPMAGTNSWLLQVPRRLKWNRDWGLAWPCNLGGETSYPEEYPQRNLSKKVFSPSVSTLTL